MNLFYRMFCKVEDQSIKFTAIAYERFEWSETKKEAMFEIFRRTVDFSTRMDDVDFDVADVNIKRCLEQHFSNDFVVSDGLAMLSEYHQGESGQLPYHEEFGQEIFHSDVDELNLADGSYVNVSDL